MIEDRINVTTFSLLSLIVFILMPERQASTYIERNSLRDNEKRMSDSAVQYWIVAHSLFCFSQGFLLQSLLLFQATGGIPKYFFLRSLTNNDNVYDINLTSISILFKNNS